MNRTRAVLGCGAVVVLGVVATAILMLNVGSFGRFSRGIHVQIEVEDAAGLNVDGDVLVAGVTVGSVSSIELEYDHALLGLKLNPGAELRTDVGARVRMRSLLAEKYIELMPRSRDAPVLAGGERLQRAEPQLDIDEVIAAFGPFMEGMDASVIRKVVGAVEKMLEDDPDAFARMVRNVDHILADGAELTGDLERTLTRSRTSLGKIDGAVVSVRARADQAERLIQRADEVLATLESAAEPLPDTIAHADQAIQDVRAAIGPVTGATEDLAKLLENFSDTDLDTLRRLLREDGVRVHVFGKGKGKKE